MRCSGWSSLAISACSALALIVAEPAAAHITVVPPFVAAGDTATLSFTAPNERDEDMTGFSLTVPSDFRIVEAISDGDWRSSIRDQTAMWTGGHLGSGSEATFKLGLEGPAEPGPASLEAEQLYPGGAIVRWAVALTVTPAEEAPSQNLVLAAAVGVIGVLIIAAVAILAWRRRESTHPRD